MESWILGCIGMCGLQQLLRLPKARHVFAAQFDTKSLMEEVLTYQMWEMNK